MNRHTGFGFLRAGMCAVLIFFAAGISFAQGVVPPAIRWDKRFGGDTSDVVRTVKNIKENKYLLAGTSYSNPSGDKTASSNGGADYWLMMTDTAGKELWDKTFGGPGDDELVTMVATLDGDYILGGYSFSGSGGDKADTSRGGADYWIIRIDADGSKKWERTLGGNLNDFLTSIIMLSSGDILVGGYSQSDVSGEKSQASKGGYDYWVVKVDKDGNIKKDLTLGASGSDQLMSMCTVVNGDVLLAGNSNSGSGGDKTGAGKGGNDYWLIRMDESLNVLWDKTYGGTGDDRLKVVMQNGSLRTSINFLLIGDSFSPAGGDKTAVSIGGYDYWVVWLDDEGNKVRDIAYGGTSSDELTCALSFPGDNVILGGFSSSGATGIKTEGTKGGNDYWLLAIDSVGKMFWNKDFGANADERLYSMELMCDRGLLLAGSSSSGINGDKTESNRGFADYWLIKTRLRTQADFSVDPLCQGESTSFKDQSLSNPETYFWDFGDPLSGDANYSEVSNPIHTYKKDGTYNVTLIVTEGCQEPDTVTKQVMVKYNPVFGIVNIRADKEEICIGEVTALRSDPLPAGTTLYWSTGDTTPVITVRDSGRYVLIAKNDGCAASEDIRIGFCPEIYVPNAFTPDGKGPNNIFYVYGIGIEKFDLYIVNRWGQTFFHSDDMKQGWDGTFNGEPMKEDVYMWICIYRGINSSEKREIGTVTLIR